MQRPNKNRHGFDFRNVAGANPEVVEFFNRERKEFQSSSCRSVSRISALSSRIVRVQKPYEHRHRNEYFDFICTQLSSRPSGRSYVLLIDPDNGIAGIRPKSEHVCGADLARIWSAMVKGDILIVYQHQFRDRDWTSKRRSTLSEAIGCNEVFCRQHRDIGSVCFFEAMKVEG
jgi:hypothetical protein